MFNSVNTLCIETYTLYHIPIIFYLEIPSLHPKSLEIYSLLDKLEWTSKLLCLRYIINYLHNFNTIFLVYAYLDTSHLFLLLFFHSFFQLVPGCLNSCLVLIRIVIIVVIIMVMILIIEIVGIIGLFDMIWFNSKLILLMMVWK